MAKVEIPDLPDNSYVSKAPKKPAEEIPKKSLEKVISGKVIQKKKPLFKRFVERFFGEDIPDVKSYLIDDLLIPTIKDTISNMVSGGIDMALFGTTKRRGMTIGNRPFTNYGTYYSGGSRPTAPKPSNNARSKKSFGELIFETRPDADSILRSLFDVLEAYGKVSIADLNGLMGVTGQFTDNYWGWTNLENADIKRVREGFLLILPDVVSLKE